MMKLWDSINPAAMLGSMGIGTEKGTRTVEETEKDRLGNCMRQDELEIQQKMSEIGRLFFRENKERTDLPEEYLLLFEAVKRLESSRLEYYQQILHMEGSMLCTECQSVIPLGSTFCNHCGQKIAAAEMESYAGAAVMDEAVPVQIPKRYCTKCNAELEQNGNFCMKCGAKADE